MTDAALTLIRHGQTEWSENGRHTSVTDLELLPAGRRRAEGLAEVLDPAAFATVLCSPRLRARQTAELAGFAGRLEIVDELAEWSYGEFEGLTTPEILDRAPGWDLWRDGCPGGESPEEVADRVDEVIDRAVAAPGPVILFAHGHILRALAARWLGETVAFGERLVLSPATISRLGSEHGLRALLAWNAPAS